MSDAKICDVCGKIITNEYKLLTIDDVCVKKGFRVILPKELDVCPDCWKKVETVLTKDKDHEGSNQ